ncbi:MAG: zinc-binding dehydrogenase [Flavobacteriales bacterium]
MRYDQNEMKAWTLIKHGDPSGAFELREHPSKSLGPYDIRVKVEGFGLNFADVMAVKGLYREAPPLPSVIGYEVVGHVIECGSAVPREMLDQRIVSMTRFGGYAEEVVTDHRAAAIIPDSMSIGEAAAMATQGCTAWYAARILAPLRKGDRVLVHSAAGGVGQLLTQLAVDSGCEVFAVASGAEKRTYLQSLGAHHVIDRSVGDPYEQLRKALGKNRLDVSFNAVGGSSFKQDLELLGSGSRLVLFGGAERGSLGGFGTLRFVWRMGLMLPIFLMMKSKSILGINMLRISENKPEIVAECLRAMVHAHATGVIRPHVYKEYDANQLVEALTALEGGKTMGKVVLRW